ncbi:MAG: NERD domain-containing protein [Rhodoferax sp.]|nr:NERD domain-containing protein [Rhodoferax sp.]
MLLKSADDKSKRVALLEDLQRSPMIDSAQQKWLRDELLRLKKGMQGERDSAHYIDSYFKDSVNNFVLHDLRFVVDGDVAQIDHLIVNRVGHFFLLETKNYSGSLQINEHGEFTAIYGNERYGIESPMEQSRRHERILVKLLQRLDITGRTQKQPDFHHVVMVHPKAVIERPPKSVLDTSDVIKADQFPTWHGQFVDQLGFGTVFKGLINIRGSESVKEWCEKLMRQHRAADPLKLPDFMQPREPVKVATPVSSASATETSAPGAAMRSSTRHSSPLAVDLQPAAPAKKLICATCSAKISYPEGKFCWNNPKRFGGLQYCREHQAQF